MKNSLCTADLMAKSGLPNCGVCPLGKRTPETNNHIIVKCHYIMHFWTSLKIRWDCMLLIFKNGLPYPSSNGWSRCRMDEPLLGKCCLALCYFLLLKFGTNLMHVSSITSTPPHTHTIIIDKIKNKAKLLYP
jgi:hypothetical protein